jgi:cytochrome c-type biogenesis protein
MHDISLIMAFAAGVVSFLSPCVLPLVPGYLSVVSGLSFDQLALSHSKPALLRRAAGHAVFFILGFSTIFVALGASATAIGQFMQVRANLFTKIGGVIVILLGLHIMGVWKIGLLYREKRFLRSGLSKGVVGAFITGLAFAFAWTPCIGPILGAILTFSATQETVSRGILLLSIYSLGLGVPFLLAALGMQSFLGPVRADQGLSSRHRGGRRPPYRRNGHLDAHQQFDMAFRATGLSQSIRLVRHHEHERSNYEQIPSADSQHDDLGGGGRGTDLGV